MATNSQLEIYKILSGRKTFRELLFGKKYYREDENLNDEDIFKYFFLAMISKLTANTVWTKEQEIKGLTLFTNEGENVNTILKCHSEHTLIEGFIDGGLFNRVGKITPKDDKSRVRQFGKNEIVTQRYYFYLSLPLDKKIALLFIEKKGENSISKITTQFLEELLKNKQSSLKFERYIPKSIIQDYRTNSVVNSFVYSMNMTSEVLDGRGVNPHEENYDIELKITPKHEQGLHFDTMANTMRSIGEMAIKLRERVVSLSTSRNIKAIVTKDSKQFRMNVEDFKVKPLIDIDDNMQEDDGTCLKRGDIKSYCDQLEASIHYEVYNIRASEN